MSKPTPHLYEKAAIAAGTSLVTARKAAVATRKIDEQGSFPVLTLRHVAHETGASYGYLRKLVKRELDDYQSIRRMKRDGTFRELSAPNPELMRIQGWILKNILNPVPRHGASYAYHRGVGIRQCAEIHVGSKWLVKMDLHNFFGEIHEDWVYRIFRGLEYPALLSFELARLCTRPDLRLPYVIGDHRGVEGYGDGSPGALPQGAPTSGALANAVARPLDNVLQGFADKAGFVYSRYSDDLTFSSPEEFSRSEGTRLIRTVTKMIVSSGFQPHRGKTRLITPGARKVVLGLMVADDGVKLLPEFRRQSLNHIRAADKYGLQSHSSHRGFESVLSMINHVDGRLAFAQGIDPIWAEAATRAWEEALKKWDYPSR
jgi:RNA-directed DNA polymerase